MWDFPLYAGPASPRQKTRGLGRMPRRQACPDGLRPATLRNCLTTKENPRPQIGPILAQKVLFGKGLLLYVWQPNGHDLSIQGFRSRPVATETCLRNGFRLPAIGPVGWVPVTRIGIARCVCENGRRPGAERNWAYANPGANEGNGR